MKRDHFLVRRITLIFLLYLVSSDIVAQKINLDELNIDQLNLYKDKAVTMRNTGIILTSSGVGIVVTGFIVGSTYHSDILTFMPDKTGNNIIVFSGIAGIVTSLFGIPLWAVGGSRNAKAKLQLKKFDIRPDNSTALRVAITFRF